MCAERFAFCQTMPLDQFLRAAEALRKSGYRPIKFRPYRVNERVQVAAVWTRDGQDWQMSRNLSAADARQQDAAWRAKGYLPVDAAGYLSADGKREAYAALWVKAAKDADDQRLFVGLTAREFQAAAYPPWLKKGYGTIAYHGMRGFDGQPRNSVVLWKPREDAFPAGWSFQPGVPEAAFFDLPASTLLRDASVFPEPNPIRHVQRALLELLRYTPVAGLGSLPWVTFHQSAKPMSERHPERQYAGTWHESATLEFAELHGLDPVQHRARCQELTAQGYRPASISATSFSTGTVTASVWHRPVVLETEKDAVARRQAQAGATLVKLGQPEAVWPLLKWTDDPRRRTLLTHALGPFHVDPETLLQQFDREPKDDRRRALLLSLGEYDEAQLPPSRRAAAVPKLRDLYRDHPDPGLHAALDWLLRRWGQGEALRQIDQDLQSARARDNRRWYVNRQGQTLVILPAGEFWMGSPASEAGHESYETLHRRRITRSFALASKEVTVAHFRRFDPAFPYRKDYSPGDVGPMIDVSWYAAARYCNWLSEQEGIAEAEWCYSKEIKSGMKLPSDYLSRSGYRLPTEAEWEYACRAGARTARAFGVADDQLLSAYAWYAGNAQDHAHACGLLRPNDWGLFDMYGNAFEWCQERGIPYRRMNQGEVVDDKEDTKYLVSEDEGRLLRGGSFNGPPLNLRSAYRLSIRPSIETNSVGLRVARTYR
jgi:formylglycine-generating enzyme required for sulfatase activity